MSNLSLIRDNRPTNNITFQGRSDANRVRLNVEDLEGRTVPCAPIIPKPPVLICPPQVQVVQHPVVKQPPLVIAGYALPIKVPAPLQRLLLERPVMNAAKITVTQLNEADGTPDNKSRVSIPFSQPIQLKNPNAISLTATVLDPASNKMRKVTIPILSAAVDNTGKNLIVNTGQQVPKGASLAIGKGALANCYGNIIGAQLATIKNSTLSAEDFLLANRSFKPTNVKLFTNEAFANAPISTFATGKALTEAQASQQLSTFLTQKIAAGQISRGQYTETMKLFNAASTKAIIPNPTIRAGLLSLRGTVADGAINAILTSNNQSGKAYSKVDFDSSMTFGTAVAQDGPNGTRMIKLNPGLKAEPFQAIGSLLAHEALHQDNINGQNEEVLAEAARAFSWAQNLLINPQLASVNSGLVRAHNTDLLALLNSGNRTFPRVGITSAPQIQKNGTVVAPKVFVGGIEGFRSLEDFARKAAAFAGIQDIDTPGNSYLDSLMKAVTRMPLVGSIFNRESMQLQDRNQQVLGTSQVLKLASILKLTF